MSELYVSVRIKKKKFFLKEILESLERWRDVIGPGVSNV